MKRIKAKPFVFIAVITLFSMELYGMTIKGVGKMVTDDGETWPHQLLLDGEKPTSYPDAVQAQNGRIYVIYDMRRSDHEPEAEVKMATFKEKDIIAGEFITDDARSNVLINNNDAR